MPTSKNMVSVQIPKVMHDKVKKAAEENNLTVNGIVYLLLDNMLTYQRKDIAHSMQTMMRRAESRGKTLYRRLPGEGEIARDAEAVKEMIGLGFTIGEAERVVEQYPVTDPF